MHETGGISRFGTGTLKWFTHHAVYWLDSQIMRSLSMTTRCENPYLTF